MPQFLCPQKEQSRSAALSTAQLGTAGILLVPQQPLHPSQQGTSSKVDGAGNMQTCLIVLEVKQCFPCDSANPHNTAESQAFIACQMETWQPRQQNNFLLFQTRFWGVPHTTVSLPGRLPLSISRHLITPCPQKHSVLNFLIMACLLFGHWDHMAPIESVIPTQFGVWLIPAAEEVSLKERPWCGGPRPSFPTTQPFTS